MMKPEVQLRLHLATGVEIHIFDTPEEAIEYFYNVVLIEYAASAIFPIPQHSLVTVWRHPASEARKLESSDE